MRNVLILTEKKSMCDRIHEALAAIHEALAAVSDHITVRQIGGHIYLKEEAEILKVSEETLKVSKQMDVGNGEIGYILNEADIAKNIEDIKNTLSEDIDVIVNACDPDRSGELLFDYVAKALNLDTDKVQRMTLRDFTETTIRESYLKAMNSVKDTDLEEEK